MWLKTKHLQGTVLDIAGIKSKDQLLITALLISLIIMIVASVILLAAVPPVSRDGLTHHLYLPKLYLSLGGMPELPWVIFSYFPMNLDLIYMIPLAFGNDIAPKFIHFTFALITALVIYRWVKRWKNAQTGLIGVLLFLSTPIILKLSISLYVDLGLICFTAVTLYAMVRWMENEWHLRYLLVAAIACGLALGTKYNGLLVLCITALLVPLTCVIGTPKERLRQGRVIGMAALYVGVAIVVFSPWMIRNAIWTGNPTYPLYDSIFSASRPESTLQESDKVRRMFEPKLNLSHFNIRSTVFRESTSQIALIPLRIFFEGEDDNPQKFDGRLNFLLLVLPFLAFIKPGELPKNVLIGQKLLAIFCLLFLLMVFFTTDMRIRYMAPAIPGFVILSACGCHRFTEVAMRLPRKWLNIGLRSALSLVILVGLLLNAFYLAHLFKRYIPLQYVSGQISRDDYIERFWPEYRVLRFANHQLPDDAMVLGVFMGNRGYYSDRSIRFSNDLLTDYIKNSQTPEEIRNRLTESGYSHVIVQTELFNHWGLSTLDPAEKERAILFFNQEIKQLFQHSRCILYGLGKKASEPSNTDDAG